MPGRSNDAYVPAPFREAGLSYRQVDYWARRGYLRPLGGGGSGNYRTWPESEVQIGLRMAILIQGGYTPAAAARLARHGIESAQQEVRTA